MGLISRVSSRTYRDDLLWNDKKISGTAAKLNPRRAYHHFTLLFNSDKDLLKKAITSPLQGWNLQTKASKSVPSPTSNLFHEKLSDAEINGKIDKFARGFCRDDGVFNVLDQESETDSVNLLKKSSDDDISELIMIYITKLKPLKSWIMILKKLKN